MSSMNAQRTPSEITPSRMEPLARLPVFFRFGGKASLSRAAVPRLPGKSSCWPRPARMWRFSRKTFAKSC